MSFSHKIINDPVHGFIDIDRGLIFELINHSFFQRLRHILQLGLTHYVYPGAVHNRFHHAIGAMHLMGQALQTLRNKGTQISDAEYTGASVAILLHDLGHGPFSHTLENSILKGIHHENISLFLMEMLNREYNGALDIAIEMFCDRYPRRFFHQLISSQLDVDRLDYLTRDSYFTGVKEGNVSTDRIIKMMQVVDDTLAIEEKGVLSIESFLNARKIMYWQVYMHKAVFGAEILMVKLFERIDELNMKGQMPRLNNALDYFLEHRGDIQLTEAAVYSFLELKDYTIWQIIDSLQKSDDEILRNLSSRILKRNLLKSTMSISSGESTNNDQVNHSQSLDYMNFDTEIEFKVYTAEKEIMIADKRGSLYPLSQYIESNGLNIMLDKKKIRYQFANIG